MGLTEDFLKSKGVTQGATNKILLCIQKLKERHQLLSTLEKVTFIIILTSLWEPVLPQCQHNRLNKSKTEIVKHKANMFIAII